MKKVLILTGHLSPDTAHVVDDYPYGYRLRCKIRYWLEYKPGKGVRFMSQTTNPKKAGEVWNKPKAGTYCRFGGCMVMDLENGHVNWTGLDHYSTGAEALAWKKEFDAGMPPEARPELDRWVNSKLAYDEARAKRPEEAAKDLTVGLKEAGDAIAAEYIKQVTPQVAALPGMTPLGIKPQEVEPFVSNVDLKKMGISE